MITARVTYRGSFALSDLATLGRGMQRRIRLSLDAGLENHRRRFLPIHFTKSALDRYAAEYQAQKRREKRGESFKQKLASMTVKERAEFFNPRTAKRRYAAWFAGLTQQQKNQFWAMSKSERDRLTEQVTSARMAKQSKSRSTEQRQDKAGDIPLLETGRLRQTALFGAVSFTGPIAMRSMNLNGLPWYTTMNKPGTINKTEALQALAAEEEIAFTKVVDNKLQQFFDGSK